MFILHNRRFSKFQRANRARMLSPRSKGTQKLPNSAATATFSDTKVLVRWTRNSFGKQQWTPNSEQCSESQLMMHKERAKTFLFLWATMLSREENLSKRTQNLFKTLIFNQKSIDNLIYRSIINERRNTI